MNRFTGLLLIAVVVIFFIQSCKEKPDRAQQNAVAVQWELIDIKTDIPQSSLVRLTLSNQSAIDWTIDNWTIHYNQIGGAVIPASLPDELSIINDNGDFFTLSPTDKFQRLPSGATRSFEYSINGFVDKLSEAPAGMFAVLDGTVLPVDLTIKGINEEILAPLNPTTAATRFLDNERLTVLPYQELLPLVPRPAEFTYIDEQKVLGTVADFSASAGLEKEISFLISGFAASGITLKEAEGDTDIVIALSPADGTETESYQLRIDQSGIVLSAATSQGIFYGIRSLVQYVSYAKQRQGNPPINIRGIEITDKPRFAYRGMHLDVARNFHSVQNVKRLLDNMSSFKLNKFHFHLTDDEGWRLEIPGLPELTEVGSKRGFTTGDTEQLLPSYGSGHDAATSYGSGYYSRSEFIELLKYANERHIEVITEIDMPGHARAAIVSMRARYNRLMKEGNMEEANYYRLDDPDDASEYSSAQNWKDGVVCICQEGAYRFMEKVFDELVKMYEEADAPLTALHIGGDEMPYGAWQKSPVCQDFIDRQPALSSSDDLPAYFMRRMKDITEKHNLITAGWEEMVIKFNEFAHNSTEIDRSLLGQRVRAYVWNAIIGAGRDDMVYRLANAGFEVVMSNSSAFYYDMAYDRDPDEIGLSWSGYANTETAFGTEPLDLFYRKPIDGNGRPLSDEYLKSRQPLSPEGRKNFLGIQSQLWSETIVDETGIEYLVFPKLLGFAERAWAPRGKWMNETSSSQIEKVYQQEWNLFANTIGQKSLVLLDQYEEGIGYRIPEPGAIIENGQLRANTAFPGLTIKYIEGGETRTYTGPVRVQNNENVILWSESSTGRRGRETKARVRTN